MGRRVAASAGVWILALAVVRVTVLLPERCPPVDDAGIRGGVAEAVEWFERNQGPDGRWLYRYDRAAGEVVPGYNVVRHAGVTMSLYQAAGAATAGALDVADAGTEYALAHLVRHDDWAAFEPSADRVSTGATALLVAGLAERRSATGDVRFDDVMGELARFLVAQAEPNGAVRAAWDRRTAAPVPDEYSPFFTGEAFWALTLMDQHFPEGGWREPARQIGRYLATERDVREGYQPDVPDHWAAYGFAVLTSGTERMELDDGEIDYLRRQAGFGGIQTRYESQRVDELPWWILRGRRTLGAGLGTVGEQLGSLWQVAGREPALADLRDPIGERTLCVAGMLLDRQVGVGESERWEDPARVRGAWFQFDVTQMDDQQHAMSALLLAAAVLEEDDETEELAWVPRVG